MSIGTLSAKIELNDRSKTYYGTTEPVTGRAILKYSPNLKAKGEPANELFGPLKLNITFHGRAKTKVWRRQGNHSTVYRGEAPLFNRTKQIYDDSFKAVAGEQYDFPFELPFPDRPERPTSGWEPAYGYDSTDKPSDSLPPSFSYDYRGFAHHFESFVQYQVGIRIAMPGIDLKFVKPDKYSEPEVRYEQSPPLYISDERPHKYSGSESVQNELLLPEADRPSGLRQKAKAVFSSDYYPIYSFDWTCVAPRLIYIGQPLAFHVRIRPHEKENTAVVVPEVLLSSFTVEIKAETNVRAQKVFISTPESYSNETVVMLRGVVDNNGPFSKADDWSKTINCREMQGLPGTFQTFNISRKYSMRIKGVFEVAGKKKEFGHQSSLTIYPPLQDPTSSADISSAEAASGFAGPSTALTTDVSLPEYVRPPEYEQHEQEEVEAPSYEVK